MENFLENRREIYNRALRSRRRLGEIKPKLISISFNNFKPFSDKNLNNIELKPITLLYGWNNSGKSSILELLQLLSEINQSINNKNSYLEFNANELSNLGSYKNFIHGNDISNDLMITYEIENIKPDSKFDRPYDDFEKDILKLVTNSKTEIQLIYSSSPFRYQKNNANLKSFSVNHFNLFSLESIRREIYANTFKISKLNIKQMNNDNFFKLIIINRSKIVTFLESIKSEIYNSDIDFKSHDSIGYQFKTHLNSLKFSLNQNLRLLLEASKVGQISPSLVSVKPDINEIKEFDNDKTLGLNFFLTSFYDYNQSTIIRRAVRYINGLLNEKENFDSDEIIRYIEDILESLDTDLLTNKRYVDLIDLYFEGSREETFVDLDETFWNKFSIFLPKELRKSFISFDSRSKDKIEKISIKQINENRNVVKKFLFIEKRYLEIKENLKELINQVKDSNRKIKEIFPSNQTFVSLTSQNQDNAIPLVKIKIEEFEELIDLLNNWDSDKKLDKIDYIKKLFHSNLEKSILLNGRGGTSKVTISKCLTLSNFLISIIENEPSLDEDKYYFFINNLSYILQSIFTSKQLSIKSQMFSHPSDLIKRNYEKKDVSKGSNNNFDYSFEKVFNILSEDKNVLTKVNDSIKKMGFDFQINFKTITGLNDETLFYPLAQNVSKSSINTHIADMGLGLKRIIPLITYLFCKRWGSLICIQEPESNLHPKYQSEIAEVLVDSYIQNENTHIVETHSEILVLRLLKLIKQKKISHENVSINFVQKKDGESEIIKIGINEKGEFTSKWPNGFFKERLSELL